MLRLGPAACLCGLVLAFGTATARAVPISIVGTNDLHGRVERTAALAGHLKNLRAKNQAAGGGVVLVDAGDMFQGTLESNLVEGSSVIDAYNALGYAAAAIGNHEFDFGPIGPAATAKTPSEDPRGALKARARQAKFPLLAANILDEATGKPVGWPNVMPSTMVTVGEGDAAVRIGIVGVTTIDTPKTTIASNVKGLRFAPLAETIIAEATALRARGARIVVVSAHAGGKCTEESTRQHDHGDLSACEADLEIMAVARALPRGLVDVIVSGHTHQPMAHVVNGVPVVQAWANGRGFSRVDFDVDAKGVVALTALHPPRRLCGPPQNDDVDIGGCAPDPYEGRAVDIDGALLRAIEPALREAKAQRTRKLGVIVDDEIRRGYDTESALGNLFADLMRDARPDAQVALMNGGGIRGNFPPGELTYGTVFEMMPFDNRFATATVTGAALRRLLEKNLAPTKKGGILSVSGMRVQTRCESGKAIVTLLHEDGRAIADDEKIVVVTTDFVATGGDGGLGVDPAAIVLDEGEPVREHIARALTRRGGHLASKTFYTVDRPRLSTAGQNTARCAR